MRTALVVALAACLAGCDLSGFVPSLKAPSSTPQQSSAAFVTSFVFNQSQNASLTQNIVSFVDASNKTITFALPYNVWNNQLALTPSVSVSPGATLSPTQNQARNFRFTVTYTVTAQDGTKNTYTTASSLDPASVSSAAEITAFLFTPSQNSSLATAITANIDSAAATISFGLPQSVWNAGATLTPSISVSPYAVANNLGPHSFLTPVQYLVSASDGTTTKLWTTSAHAYSSAAAIVSFVFLQAANPSLSNDITATLDGSTNTINFLLPAAVFDAGTVLSPTIVVSQYANQTGGVAQSYTTSKQIVVTAEDGTTRTWATVATRGS